MLENFYSIIKQEVGSESASVQVRFNVAHPIFQGHFPAMPVVPGACMVQMVSELMSSVLQKKLQVVAVRNIKFLQLIYPETAGDVTFSMTWTEAAGGIATQCRVHKEDTTYAIMKVIFSESVF